MTNETQPLKDRLQIVLAKIEDLQRQQSGGYTAQVAKSFHLGMVGGSGRNTTRLNAIRGNEIERTIERAKKLVELYKERDGLQRQIQYIESGQREADAIRREEVNKKLALYFKSLKVGDMIDIGGNQPAQITKKNAKSIETGTGCKWTAAEIIGKKAAAYLNN